MMDSWALTHSTYGKNMKDKLHTLSHWLWKTRCATYFRQGDIFRYRQQIIIQLIKKINRIHQVVLPNYQNIESKKNRTSTHTSQKRLRSPSRQPPSKINKKNRVYSSNNRNASPDYRQLFLNVIYIELHFYFLF